MAPHLLRPMYAFRMLSNSVTGGRRAPWHSAPFVSPGLRPPPLPHCAERHTALRLQALLAGRQSSRLAYPQRRLPWVMGWMVQRNKGGEPGAARFGGHSRKHLPRCPRRTQSCVKTSETSRAIRPAAAKPHESPAPPGFPQSKTPPTRPPPLRLCQTREASPHWRN